MSFTNSEEMRFPTNSNDDSSMTKPMLSVDNSQTHGNYTQTAERSFYEKISDTEMTKENYMTSSRYHENSFYENNLMSGKSETSRRTEKSFRPLFNSYQVIPSDILKLEIAQYLLNLNPQLLQELLNQTCMNSLHNCANEPISNITDYSMHPEVPNPTHFFVPVEGNILENYHNHIYPPPVPQLPFPFRLHNENVPVINDENYSQPAECEVYLNEVTDNSIKNVNEINQSPDLVSGSEYCEDPQQTYIIFRVNNHMLENAEELNNLCLDPSSKKSSSLPPENHLNKLINRKHSKGRLCSNCIGTINEQNTFEATKFETSSSPSLGTGSRFRVKRIADANSWWSPKASKSPFVVHDLKTSSIPEYINIVRSRTEDIQKNILSGVIKSMEDMQARFWNILDPKYFQKIRHKNIPKMFPGLKPENYSSEVFININEVAKTDCT